MKKQLIEENPTPFAYDAVSYSGIELYAIVYGIDDKVLGKDGNKIFLHKLQENAKGETYFRHENIRYYMNNFMRINL